jgi:IgA Peptidase M64
MPITGINWIEGEGHDIHLLRGRQGPALLGLLEVTEEDGSVTDLITYLIDNDDVTISFLPSFDNVLDLNANPPVSRGFGITINNNTGSVRAKAPPDDPVIHNFLLHVIAEDASDDSEYRTSLRIHLHNRVTAAWLTPPVLTLRPVGDVFPQTTDVRFSVRAEFDDETIGDLTHHPGIQWRPSSNVTNTGRLIIAAGNTPGDPAVKIQAVLPLDLQDPANPIPLEVIATGHIRFAAPWASESKIRTETVQIQDTWPGTINPELVPNFLFLCDGYKAEDKPKFEGQVRSLLALMKKSKLTRPFDLLATSMNYYQALIPSDHHGISVLCEVYPEQNSEGEIKEDSRGVVNWYCVPNAKEPSEGKRWGVSNVIYRLGLPVPVQGLDQDVEDIRDYWDSIVDDVPHDLISDNTVRKWQKLALRSFLEEPDTVLGLAYGQYPSVSEESDDRNIGFHPLRMTRSGLDAILSRLVDAQGNSLSAIWTEQPDGSRPNSYPLIFTFSSLKWDRGVNLSAGYIAMNVEDRDAIPARSVDGKPTYEIDLTGKITNRISHSRLVRACHEVAHSFGLGDEYNEKGRMPQSDEIDLFYGNLQKHSDVEDPQTGEIHGDLIKWRWHRIRKAAVIAGEISELEPDKFRIPVILGQANQFAIGDEVLLRFREFPNPLPRNPRTSNLLEVIGVADPGGLLDPSEPAGADNPLVGAIIVTPGEGETFTPADAADFPPGCIVYLPVPASELVIEPDYLFAELVAKNIKDHITKRKRALNQDPDDERICVPDKNDVQKPVKLDVDLPFCFCHKNRIVGLFTGGRKYDCGVYHPAGNCIMRNSDSDGKEFCAVCRYLLVDIIDPYKHFLIDLDYEKIYPQK